MICQHVDQFRDDQQKDFIPCMHVFALKEWNIACQHICIYISSKQRSWVSIIISQASNRKNNLSMFPGTKQKPMGKKCGTLQGDSHFIDQLPK